MPDEFRPCGSRPEPVAKIAVGNSAEASQERHKSSRRIWMSPLTRFLFSPGASQVDDWLVTGSGEFMLSSTSLPCRGVSQAAVDGRLAIDRVVDELSIAPAIELGNGLVDIEAIKFEGQSFPLGFRIGHPTNGRSPIFSFSWCLARGLIH